MQRSTQSKRKPGFLTIPFIRVSGGTLASVESPWTPYPCPTSIAIIKGSPQEEVTFLKLKRKTKGAY
jgi:hypothetical protein